MKLIPRIFYRSSLSASTISATTSLLGLKQLPPPLFLHFPLSRLLLSFLRTLVYLYDLALEQQVALCEDVTSGLEEGELLVHFGDTWRRGQAWFCGLVGGAGRGRSLGRDGSVDLRCDEG